MYLRSYAQTIKDLVFQANIRHFYLYSWSILVMWLESWFLDTEVDGLNPGISMSCT